MANAFNALAHPTRLEILDLLRNGEACVCHIQAMLNQRQAYVSQHLNVLRQAGLVSSRKDGLRMYYQVADTALINVIDEMSAYLKATGRLQLEDADKKPGLPCTCPQCSDQQSNPRLETSHA